MHDVGMGVVCETCNHDKPFFAPDRALLSIWSKRRASDTVVLSFDTLDAYVLLDPEDAENLGEQLQELGNELREGAGDGR